MMMHCMQNTDFSEGIRALLVDRDNKPQWEPSELRLVTTDEVDSYFQPLEEGYDLDVFQL